MRPVRPDWLLLNACVDMELLSIKHRNKTADIVQEYYIHRDKIYSNYLQLFTDGSKDPLTEATDAAVVIPIIIRPGSAGEHQTI